MTAKLVALHRNFNSESLKVNDNGKHDQSRQQTRQVWCMRSKEGFTHGTHLIRSGDDQVEEGQNSSMELSTTTSVNSGW